MDMMSRHKTVSTMGYYIYQMYGWTIVWSAECGVRRAESGFHGLLRADVMIIIDRC